VRSVFRVFSDSEIVRGKGSISVLHDRGRNRGVWEHDRQSAARAVLATFARADIGRSFTLLGRTVPLMMPSSTRWFVGGKASLLRIVERVDWTAPDVQLVGRGVPVTIAIESPRGSSTNV